MNLQVGQRPLFLLGWVLLAFFVVGCVPLAADSNGFMALPATMTLPAPEESPAPAAAAEAPFSPTVTPPASKAQKIKSLFPFMFPTPTMTATAVPTPTPSPSPTPLPCSSAGEMVSGVVESTLTQGGAMAYRVYLPPCYGVDDRTYPTLYMLPGNIHTDAIWDELGLDEDAESAILEGKMPPFLIVMVNGGWLADTTSGGEGSYEQFFMQELIPAVETEYCAWPDRAGRALGGMSRGGYWALEIAFRHPDAFASAGGHSASLYDFYGGPEVNPQVTGIENDLGDLRIYFDIGENDGYIPNLRQLHEDMRAKTISHEWVVNPGYHQDAYWAAHTADYLAWYTAPWPLDREFYPLCE